VTSSNALTLTTKITTSPPMGGDHNATPSCRAESAKADHLIGLAEEHAVHART